MSEVGEISGSVKLDTSELERAQREARKHLDKMGEAAEGASKNIDGLEDAVDKASSELGKAEKELKKLQRAADGTDDSIDEVSQSLDEAEDETARLAREMDRLEDELGLVDRGAERADDSLDRMDSTFGRASNTSSVFGGVLAGSLAAEGLQVVADAAIDAGREMVKFTQRASRIRRNAQAAGLTAQAYQELLFAFERFGLEGRDLMETLSTLSERQYDARQGSEGLRDDFRSLGITMADLKTASPEELLRKVAAGLEETEDPTSRLKGAVSLLGDEVGNELVAHLAGGERGLEELTDQARNAASTLDEDTLESAAKANEEFKDMKQSLSELATQAKTGFIPSMRSVSTTVDTATSSLVEFNKAAEKYADKATEEEADQAGRLFGAFRLFLSDHGEKAAAGVLKSNKLLGDNKNAHEEAASGAEANRDALAEYNDELDATIRRLQQARSPDPGMQEGWLEGLGERFGSEDDDDGDDDAARRAAERRRRERERAEKRRMREQAKYRKQLREEQNKARLREAEKVGGKMNRRMAKMYQLRQERERKIAEVRSTEGLTAAQRQERIAAIRLKYENKITKLQDKQVEAARKKREEAKARSEALAADFASAETDEKGGRKLSVQLAEQDVKSASQGALAARVALMERGTMQARMQRIEAEKMRAIEQTRLEYQKGEIDQRTRNLRVRRAEAEAASEAQQVQSDVADQAGTAVGHVQSMASSMAQAAGLGQDMTSALNGAFTVMQGISQAVAAMSASNPWLAALGAISTVVGGVVGIAQGASGGGGGGPSRGRSLADKGVQTEFADVLAEKLGRVIEDRLGDRQFVNIDARGALVGTEEEVSRRLLGLMSDGAKDLEGVNFG